MHVLLLFDLLADNDVLHGFTEESLATANRDLGHHKPFLEGSLEVFEEMPEIAHIDALRVKVVTELARV